MSGNRFYNAIESAYPYRLRGTNQQSQTGLLYTPPAYKNGGSTFYLPGLGLSSFALQNRSGSPVVAGLGVRLPNRLWSFGQWTNATTTFTDDTTDAQSTTTADVALEVAGTNNDGYIVASPVKFNAISLNIATASAGGSPVRALRYSNSAGTGWATAPANLFVQDAAAAHYATGEALVVFEPPVDWGKSSGLATGLSNGLYAINVRATTAPTATAGVATALEVFRLFYLTESVLDNDLLSQDLGDKEFPMAWDAVEGYYGDALVALFETANDMNRVTALVRSLG